MFRLRHLMNFSGLTGIKPMIILQLCIGANILYLVLHIGNSCFAIIDKEMDFPEEPPKICGENFEDRRLYVQNRPLSEFKDIPMIYIVTATYPRVLQIVELTRMSNTLLHVPQIHWIVANEESSCVDFLERKLSKLDIPYTHLSSCKPKVFRKAPQAGRGAANKRAALRYINQRQINKGVLYFADDDNTYDLKLFSEIRTTNNVSMFPVGLIGDYGVSSPVAHNAEIIGFFDSWPASRRWAVDMAGFAVNLAYLAKCTHARMPYVVGYQEDFFLKSLHLKLDLIELKANNATEILVWHTQSVKKSRANIQIDRRYVDERTNFGELFKTLESMGIASISDSTGKMAVITKNGSVKTVEKLLDKI